MIYYVVPPMSDIPQKVRAKRDDAGRHSSRRPSRRYLGVPLAGSGSAKANGHSTRDRGACPEIYWQILVGSSDRRAPTPLVQVGRRFLVRTCLRFTYSVGDSGHASWPIGLR